MRRRTTIAILWCTPLLLLVLGLVVFPFLYSIYLSLLNKAQTKFIGLGNFAFLFTRDTFWMVVEQSAIFAVSAVFFKALIGIITAHLVNNLPGKGQRKWRGMLLVPWVMPLSLSTLTWWWMFDPTYSAFNWILGHFGGHIAWLSEPYWARFCAILVNVWFGAPFFLIMYLAALKSVPEQLYEAASIDGANAWQRFVHITLPMMRNIIAITVLFSLIVTFANYDIVRVLTAGGPRNMTHVFATWAFELGIQSGDIPLGSAISLFMFPLLGISAFFILRGVLQTLAERNLMTAEAATAGHPAPELPRLALAQPALGADPSYFFLILFAIFFLIPPYYPLVTATKDSAQISNQSTDPWMPVLPAPNRRANITTRSWLPAAVTDFSPIYLHETRISRSIRTALCTVVVITMLIARACRVLAGAHEILGLGHPRDRRVPDLSRAGFAAVHSAVQGRGRRSDCSTPIGGWCWSIPRSRCRSAPGS